MIDLAGLQRAFQGRALAPADFVVHGYEAWLVSDCVLAADRSTRSTHPLHIFLAGILGMSTTMQDIWAEMGSGAEDGPMFGELTIEQRRPIRPEEPLRVSGQYLSVDRKSGRSGVFDVLTFRLDLADAAGESIAGVINSFVFPRSADETARETA